MWPLELFTSDQKSSFWAYLSNQVNIFSLKVFSSFFFFLKQALLIFNLSFDLIFVATHSAILRSLLSFPTLVLCLLQFCCPRIDHIQTQHSLAERKERVSHSIYRWYVLTTTLSFLFSHFSCRSFLFSLHLTATISRHASPNFRLIFFLVFAAYCRCLSPNLISSMEPPSPTKLFVLLPLCSVFF